TLRIFPDGRFWARLDRRDAVYHRAQIRILSKNDQPLEMTLFAVEGIEREEEARVLSGEKEARPSPEPFEVLTDSISRPAVVSRAEWGANPPIGTYIPHSPYRLTQHHTAGRRVSTLAEGIAEMQFIQDFHQNGRGWQDIGYHFLVDDAGRLYEGVPSDYRGTHVGNNNTGNVGISYMGNLDLAGENPTTTALLSLADMWSWLAYHYTINPDSLFGHRDYNSTACPGGNLYVRLPNLRNAVRGQLGFGAPYVIYPVPQPFSQEVDPGSHIQFSIVDDVEGVDISSIDVRLNGAPISPVILGDSSQVNVLYQPPAPFPASQNVVVNVYALDLGAVPDTLRYSYTFSIEIAALQVELNSPTTVSNGSLNLSGGWSIDSDDATITGLANGNRLIARDTDSSHVARIFPGVTQPGDYRIQMATGSNFLGESSRLIFVDDNGRAHTVFREYNTLTLDQWSTVAPTPVYLNGDAADSLGYFELRGIGDMPTRLILDAFRLEKVDRYDPPTIPNLKSVRLTNPASREVEVAWYPNLEGDIAGYRLFASDDGRSWSDTPFADETLLGPTAETYRFNYPGATTQAYFRLVAVDTNEVELPGGLPEPLLSPVSDIYGVGFQRRGEILIVDNFDRRGSWQAAQHPFARSHGEALDDQEHGFDTCSETAVQNGDVRLEDYDVVFYFCGDDSRSDESLAAADQYRLAEYLFNGGKLFISGSEIGYDFASTTNEELQRYE
ncbi:MAG TPA: peptidoglycan recognition family protein, partial [Calditrichia bacterium]|nr:peptidoglycan recognition family protein [Calditrichia bacterium]